MEDRCTLVNDGQECYVEHGWVHHNPGHKPDIGTQRIAIGEFLMASYKRDPQRASCENSILSIIRREIGSFAPLSRAV
jgi:hypothetical protein